jgi:hypothetical protein
MCRAYTTARCELWQRQHEWRYLLSPACSWGTQAWAKTLVWLYMHNPYNSLMVLKLRCWRQEVTGVLVGVLCVLRCVRTQHPSHWHVAGGHWKCAGDRTRRTPAWSIPAQTSQETAPWSGCKNVSCAYTQHCMHDAQQHAGVPRQLLHRAVIEAQAEAWHRNKQRRAGSRASCLLCPVRRQ